MLLFNNSTEMLLVRTLLREEKECRVPSMVVRMEKNMRIRKKTTNPLERITES